MHMGDLMSHLRHPRVDRPSGASIKNWLVTLENTVKDHNADTLYIFGHSKVGAPVTGSSKDLLALRDYFSAMLAYVQKGMRQGSRPTRSSKAGCRRSQSTKVHRSCRWPTTSSARRRRRSLLVTSCRSGRVPLPQAHPPRIRVVGARPTICPTIHAKSSRWEAAASRWSLTTRPSICTSSARTKKRNPADLFSRDGEWRCRWLHREVLPRIQGASVSADSCAALSPDTRFEAGAVDAGRDLRRRRQHESMLATWREWEMPRLLRQAWRAGTVLAGVSAGGMCWFTSGVTDSAGHGLTGLSCLGLLPGTCCPHFDGEPERRARTPLKLRGPPIAMVSTAHRSCVWMTGKPRRIITYGTQTGFRIVSSFSVHRTAWHGRVFWKLSKGRR